MVRVIDCFAFDPCGERFDLSDERAFLYVLPRRTWPHRAPCCAQQLGPARVLAGFFFCAANPKGPRSRVSSSALHSLPALCEPAEDRPASESLAGFDDGERWQVGKRRHVNAR